jgi:putative endonuclease
VGVDTRPGIGRTGETAALASYLAAGYRVVARNWRCPLGELDLILTRSGTVVFCEVKARSGTSLGGPFDAVTVPKQRKVRRLAEAFLRSSDGGADQIRFDVASVMVRPDGSTAVHVFEDAF